MSSFCIRVVWLLLAATVLVSIGDCLPDRNGRRCPNGHCCPNAPNRGGHPYTNSDNDDEEESGYHHGDRHGHSRHPATEKLNQKKGNSTKMTYWPGHSLNANSSWNSLSNQHQHQNRDYELTTEVTTTESSNDIERFLVGKRRKRNAFWLNLCHL